MIGDVLKRLGRLAWFLPGFLLWAAFPPMAETCDVLFALAPLMWLSRCGDRRESARRWFQSGAFYWVATLSWMPAIVKNGGPWPLVVLGWFALGAYCAAYFAAYGYLSAAYWRWANIAAGRRCAWVGVTLRVAGFLLVEPVLWCGLELVRSRAFGGFAWNQLGVVPANVGFGSPAAWGGVYLLSAVVLLINGTLAGIAERMIAAVRRRPTSRWRSVETLVTFLAVWGIYQLPNEGASPAASGASRPVKIALLQRNFPCVFRAQSENPYAVYGALLDNVATFEPDLVVLPESAMAEFGPLDQQGAVRFAEWLARRCPRAALLAGGTRYADEQTFNSAALYGRDGAIQLYDKVHLVPFGEYIPGDKLFPALQKLAPVGSCTAGSEKLLTLDGVPLGVAICFEDTDSALMRSAARQGAQMLVFITNDSWFSHSGEALQHAWQATARAIETGLPIVRVGNSGVTGSVTRDGRATWLVGTDGKPLVDRRGTMFDRIAVAPRAPTPYVRHGDIPLVVLFALLIGAMILVKYRDIYEKRRELSL